MHDQIDPLHAAFAFDGDVFDLHRTLFADRFAYHAGECFTQAVARHGVYVDVGLAHRWLQIFAGAAADIENVAFAIDQHGGRCPGLLYQLVGELADIFVALKLGAVIPKVAKQAVSREFSGKV